MYCGKWKFNITDFPGEFVFDASTDTELLRKANAVVYVHDAQQNPKERSAQALIEIMQEANRVNPDIFYTVFIHKVDSDMFNSEEQRDEVFNEFSMYVRDQLRTADMNVQIAFYITSIFDHTVFEKMSLVVQRLFPFVEHLTSLMDHLVASSRIEKAFLFDLVSKIYIATDPTPVDIQHFEICSELIDVLIDVSCIYGDIEHQSDASGCTTIKLKTGEGT